LSGLVIDELACHLVLAWLRDGGNKDPLTAYRAAPETIMQAMRERLSATWHALDSLRLELEPTTRDVVERAQRLMADPGLAPRDASTQLMRSRRAALRSPARIPRSTGSLVWNGSYPEGSGDEMLAGVTGIGQVA
jgi:hypothetical protein